MRKTAGIAVLLLGTAGLGWWAHGHQARTIETKVTDAAQAVADGMIHDAELRVSGRDIVVTGLADTEAERDAIKAQLDAVNGRRVVRADFKVLPSASPYTFTASKVGGGDITARGLAPTAADLAALSAATPGAGVTLAHGAPEGWTDSVTAGLGALTYLHDGTLDISDRRVSLSGTAASTKEVAAVEAALADLPDGVERDITLNLIDDGAPADYAMSYEAGSGARLTGRSPAGLSGEDIGAAIGLAQFENTAQEDVAPDAVAAMDAGQGQALLSALAPQLPQLERLAVTVKGSTPDGDGATPIRPSIVAQAVPGADPEEVAAEMRAALPEGVDADITVTTVGRLDGAEGTERVNAATGATEYLIDGQWVQTASPYTFAATRADGATAVTGGMVPSAQAREELALVLGDQADVLTPAHGAPDGWSAAALSGTRALQGLTAGDLSINDRTVRLTGLAATSADEATARAALGAIPEGYEVEADIAVSDDGLPASYALAYDAEGGARLDGRLPQGLSAADAADALGLSQLSDNTEADLTADADAEAAYGKAVLGGFARLMPQIEEMQIDVDGATKDAAAQARASVRLIPGADGELVRESILAALPEGTDLSVQIEETAPLTGVAERTRVNAATGETERLSGGYWLPARDFAVSLDGCQAETSQVLKDYQIGFVSGSARLNAEAARSVNVLAAVVGPCLESGLTAELGGHTDSTGSLELNTGLSQDRADAVRAALIARGIGSENLTAKGYGPSQPIATNDTEEGRAENRRTEIIWSAAAPQATDTNN